MYCYSVRHYVSWGWVTNVLSLVPCYTIIPDLLRAWIPGTGLEEEIETLRIVVETVAEVGAGLEREGGTEMTGMMGIEEDGYVSSPLLVHVCMTL